jgi:hypothetical protein
VLVVPVDSEEQGDQVGAILSAAKAESLDAARESWWIGLRDAEEAEYTGEQDFASLEGSYRMGFEAAQHEQFSEKRFEDAFPFLSKRYSTDLCKQPSFRLGYERGQKYAEQLQERFPPIEAL